MAEPERDAEKQLYLREFSPGSRAIWRRGRLPKEPAESEEKRRKRRRSSMGRRKFRAQDQLAAIERLGAAGV